MTNFSVDIPSLTSPESLLRFQTLVDDVNDTEKNLTMALLVKIQRDTLEAQLSVFRAQEQDNIALRNSLLSLLDLLQKRDLELTQTLATFKPPSPVSSLLPSPASSHSSPKSVHALRPSFEDRLLDVESSYMMLSQDSMRSQQLLSGITLFPAQLNALQEDLVAALTRVDSTDTNVGELTTLVQTDHASRLITLDQAWTTMSAALVTSKTQLSALQVSVDALTGSDGGGVSTPLPLNTHTSGSYSWESPCKTLPSGIPTTTKVTLQPSVMLTNFQKLNLGDPAKPFSALPSNEAVARWIVDYLRIVSDLLVSFPDADQARLMLDDLHPQHRMHSQVYLIYLEAAGAHFNVPDAPACSQLVVDYLWFLKSDHSGIVETRSSLDSVIAPIKFNHSNSVSSLALTELKAKIFETLDAHGQKSQFLSTSSLNRKNATQLCTWIISKMRPKVRSMLDAEFLHTPSLAWNYIALMKALAPLIEANNKSFALELASKATPSFPPSYPPKLPPSTIPAPKGAAPAGKSPPSAEWLSMTPLQREAKKAADKERKRK
jgi:hypothetical protein